MSTINNRVLECFRKKLSKDQLTQLFNLLNKINFNRTLKSKGGSVGSLMDTSLNQPLKINKIDTIQSVRAMYQKGGQVNKSEILDLISKIDFKDLNFSNLKLIKDLRIILEDK
ncbi:hypothetical protein OAT23_01405 [Candidatus Pelagibacter sp.]|nr:hypothetical protein [Candidatus Pelagibacter sp.]